MPSDYREGKARRLPFSLWALLREPLDSLVSVSFPVNSSEIILLLCVSHTFPSAGSLRPLSQAPYWLEKQNIFLSRPRFTCTASFFHGRVRDEGDGREICSSQYGLTTTEISFSFQREKLLLVLCWSDRVFRAGRANCHTVTIRTAESEHRTGNEIWLFFAWSSVCLAYFDLFWIGLALGNCMYLKIKQMIDTVCMSCFDIKTANIWC